MRYGSQKAGVAQARSPAFFSQRQLSMSASRPWSSRVRRALRADDKDIDAAEVMLEDFGQWRVTAVYFR